MRSSSIKFKLVAVAVFGLLIITACGGGAVAERVENVGGVTAGQIIENPANFVGKVVTVSGEIESIQGPRAFSMDSGLNVGELLVIGREAFPQLPDAGNRAYLVKDVATVTGVVRTMVTADVEREIGWDLDPQIETEFNARPVLIAQTIAFRPGTGVVAAVVPLESPAAANTNTNTNSTASEGPLTDIGVFGSTADKLSLVGRDVRFTNARVVRVVGPRTFTVSSGNTELYVMLDEASARGVGTQGKIGIGDSLSIDGRFERLQAAEINDLGNARFRPLTDVERSFLKSTQIYLQTSRVGGVE